MIDVPWTAAYSDSDLTFYMLVYRDHEQAVDCLTHLRRHFPQARIIVRSDGDRDPRHRSLVRRFKVDYREEARLFPIENGGAIVQRMFQQYLEQPTKYLLKVDPDTAIHRRFRYLPAQSCHFGTLQGKVLYRGVQGGCMGFTADVATAIADSRLLLSDRLRDPKPGLDRTYWTVLANRAARCGLTSFDWSIGWVVDELHLPLVEFPEVYCKSNDNPQRFVDNGDLRYAVTHPECALVTQHAKIA